MIKINDETAGDFYKVPCVMALDAMGGDNAPDIVIDGAAIAHKKYPNLKFIFFGNEDLISPVLDKHSSLKAVSSIRHTSDVITSDMKPSLALRQGRNSSMRLAINAVSAGEADCIVSAGNTGALMVLAKFVLKTLPGIDRPAIATMIPSQKGSTVVLDLGANIECDSENLVQFSLMGAIFCKTILGKEMPTIGLLNIGTEELKGHEEVRIAASILKERPIPGRLYGFIEGNDITSGTVDVVVTDGFSGNIALKSIEGAAGLYSYFIKRTIASSLLAKIGFFLASFALADLKKKVDPRHYNGAMFLGLRGVCVKSHGGADAAGFANAIGVAHSLVAHAYNARIAKEIAFQYGSDIEDDEAGEEEPND
ncbi:MAG: phosphate acyltransferase PlsX [Alphaproteobacteria bacterium]|nr:phosphate acyltransferase PlsX [Alphaproteobacteria bacterium]MCL2504918.1 phosphate acyltransferase PlsX [Alphaproteobacteria bacterium]